MQTRLRCVLLFLIQLMLRARNKRFVFGSLYFGLWIRRDDDMRRLAAGRAYILACPAHTVQYLLTVLTVGTTCTYIGTILYVGT